MREVKVARVIDHTECIIVCGGWSIAFVWLAPLGEKIPWQKFHGNAIDDRPSPQPPITDPLRPFKPLSRQEWHAARRLAIGVLNGKRESALKTARKAGEAERRRIEEPKFL